MMRFQSFKALLDPSASKSLEEWEALLGPYKLQQEHIQLALVWFQRSDAGPNGVDDIETQQSVTKEASMFDWQHWSMAKARTIFFCITHKKPRTIDGQDDQGVQQAYPSQDVVGADVSGVSIQTMLVANEGPLNVMGLKTLVE